MTDSKIFSVKSIALIAALISLLVFIKSVFGDFVNYDDTRFVVENPGIRSLDGRMILSALTQQFSNDYWAPLTWISFAVDYYFWGLNPFGYHLVNILLHSVNTGLVVFIADRVFQQVGGPPVRDSRNLYIAGLLIAGLLWSLHPLRVESVSWVSERKDVLYGMFALSALLCYIRDIEFANKGARGYYFLSIAMFVLALMSKPTAVFLPMLLLVIDWYPYKCLSRGRYFRTLVEKLPFFLLTAGTTYLTIYNMSKTSVPYSYNQFTFWERVVISGHSIFEFCRLMFFPVGIHLFNTIAALFAKPLPAYLQTAAVFAFTGWALIKVKKYPGLLAVWLLFLIPLLPTLAFFQVGVDVTYSSRHSYLASVTPTIVFALICMQFLEKRSLQKRIIWASFLALLMCFHIAMTQHLIAAWKDSGTLWTRVIKFNPIGRAYNYRGLYLAEKGRFSPAGDDFIMAAKGAEEAGNPEAFNYYAYAGDAYNRSGRYEDAVKAFSNAIRLSPWPEYMYHRGMALKLLGRYSDAAEDFRQAGEHRGEIVFHKMW